MAEPTRNYDEMSLTELQEEARARDIAGRSTMNLEELRTALTADVAGAGDDGDPENAGEDPAAAEAASGPFRSATRNAPITANASGRPR